MAMVKVRNPLNQSVRTLVMNEATKKYEEVAIRAKEIKEISEPLSSLTEQQVLNGALQKFGTKKTDPTEGKKGD